MMRGCLIALVLALAVNPALASARAHDTQLAPPARQAPGSQNGISRAQAAAIVQREMGGRVLSVTPSGDGRAWRVKLLLDGERVRNVSVDAQTGRIR